jgi:spore maturation protein CgeB
VNVALFCHSLVSDWNHGNAHFLRGVVAELAARGHRVRVFEPEGGWSYQNLVADHGDEAIAAVRAAFPWLRSTRYDLARFDVGEALDGVDLAIVHEWSDRELVRRVGEERARRHDLALLFHDTHHRAVTAPHEIAALPLEHFDGALVFGAALREVYLARDLAARCWVWHEAADTRAFSPRPADREDGDVVFVGNHGDGERSRELDEYLFGPVRELGLRATIHGVRYPAEARAVIAAAGAAYRGYLPNHRVPEVLARHRATVHVPRRPYAEALPGIPTIRVFEALACGAALVSGPWRDAEGLFSPGEDYLVAEDGAAMTRHLRALAADRDLARAIGERGRRTVLARHTCAHRVDELALIAASLGVPDALKAPAEKAP